MKKGGGFVVSNSCKSKDLKLYNPTNLCCNFLVTNLFSPIRTFAKVKK